MTIGQPGVSFHLFSIDGLGKVEIIQAEDGKRLGSGLRSSAEWQRGAASAATTKIQPFQCGGPQPWPYRMP